MNKRPIPIPEPRKLFPKKGKKNSIKRKTKRRRRFARNDTYSQKEEFLDNFLKPLNNTYLFSKKRGSGAV